ncbi:MAG: iron-containing alcohol dehydrogenase [Candidatus Lokiarchaeota archaeon]|nr:iron-containing alcohol dehydrogenase [Candidatus Lokiarchaeota archaeon]
MPLKPFSSPTIHYGRGSLKALRNIKGKKVLIVTDKTLTELGIVEKVTKQIEKSKEKMEYRIFDEIEPDPIDNTIMKGVEIAKEFEPDWFIGLGGGSSMDAAKTIWILYERPDLDLKEIIPMKYLGLRKKAKIIMIPTTSGTGSEVTWAMVITDSKRKAKLSLGSEEAVADIAIVDPALTMTMPPKVTAYTGVDALTHAIEGFISTVKNDYSDGLCLKAMKLIFKNLPIAVNNGEDKDAREAMHNAATISGLGFGNSQAGLAHAAGHSIGAKLNIPHGIAVGIMLPYVIQFCQKTSEEYFKEINTFIGLKGEGAAAKILANHIMDLYKQINFPTSIKEIISKEEFDEKFSELVRFTLIDPSGTTNPRKIEKETAEALLIAAYEGKDIDF